MAKRRIFSTALALVLLLNSLTLSLSPHPTVASPDEAKWSRVSIPTEGKPGDWVLASGSRLRGYNSILYYRQSSGYIDVMSIYPHFDIKHLKCKTISIIIKG